MAQRVPDPNGARKGGGPDLRLTLISYAITLALLVLWFVLTLPHATTSLSLPYSDLLGQVRAGNVTSVELEGDAISGTFRHAVPAPMPSAAAATSSPAPQAAPSAAAPLTYDTFTSTFPQAVGDPRFLPLLEAHGVAVDVHTTQTSFLTSVLLTWAPWLLVLGVFIWINARAARNLGSPFSFGKSKPVEYENRIDKVTFADVAGADEAKIELQEEVDFLRRPERYHAVGAHVPKGVLLSGSPGTGKTLLARAVAGEAGVPFLSLNASEFVEMFVGVGASRVRDLFKRAKESAPAIVFIDELDAVGRRRGAGIGNTNDEREQTLNQLLAELDGFDPHANIIVLAATNRPDVLDPALLRPGRFDRQVTIGLPDRHGRRDILAIHARKLKLANDISLETLAGQTIGMSGADLANLCNEAALASVRHDRDAVAMAHFEEALDRIRLGLAHPQLMDAEEREVVAYHESGHTLAAWLTAGADPVQKITIVPHGQALGLTEQVPVTERHNLSRAYVRARIVVMLAGRVAEELVFGEITTGAENDLVEATQLARQMVTRWGMSDLGLAAFRADERQPFLGYELTQGRDYSEQTAARIDAAVQDILATAHAQVSALLGGERTRLDRLARALLQTETLELAALTTLLGPPAAAVTSVSASA